MRNTDFRDPLLDRGNYMQVWKSQPDGQCRFEREIWNSSIPASPPDHCNNCAVGYPARAIDW